MSAGHGGQILISLATEELSRDALPEQTSLQDLGKHCLRDVTHPEQLFQLNIDNLPNKFPPLKTMDVFPNNLPLQLTTFIGREKQTGEIKQKLSQNRLVTLTGPGGTGKTRLSLQVAAELLDKFDDGIWLVELAPITDPELVPKTILLVMGVQEQPGKTQLDALKEYILGKQILIVLDNCEHLIESCARVITVLLNAAPKLRILTSSRETLGISGELSYPVPSLLLPDLVHLPDIEQLSQYEAIRLFIDRATSVQPAFTLTSQNSPAVAQICHHLDGIPLAIELAAARMKALTAEQIAARLDDRFRLLTSGGRTAPLRQQTLRTLIDWSYDLLSEPERILLRRISVFNGGFTLDAVENITGNQPIETNEVFDLLTHLIDKSLIIAENRNGEMRYRLLETIQKYAGEKLQECDELQVVKNRHLEHFLRLGEQTEKESQGSHQKSWLDKLETELDNLRTALSWTLESRNAEASLRFLGALPRFWQLRSYLTEGLDWSEKLLAMEVNNSISEPSNSYLAAKAHGFSEVASFWGACSTRRMPVNIETLDGLLNESLTIYKQLRDLRGQANVLRMMASLALFQNHPDSALAAAKECLQLSRAVGDKWLIAEVLTNVLGFGAALLCDYESAKTYLAEALSLRKDLDDRDGATYTLILLGVAVLYQGNYDEAAKYLNEALVLSKEVGNVFMTGVTLSRLAPAVAGLGRDNLASQYLLDGLELSREINDKSFSVLCLNELGGLLGKWKQWELSAKLLGAASMQLEGVLPIWVGPGVHERYVTFVRNNLDEITFGGAWSYGQAMTLEDAIAYALENKSYPIPIDRD
jgi:predicted ATPase